MAQLDKVIKARVTEEEKRVLGMAVKIANTTESEFIRKIVGYGAQEILAEETGKIVEGVSGLNEKFNILTGIKPGQLMKILFFMAEVAEEGGKTNEFDAIWNLIFRKQSFGSTIAHITSIYGEINNGMEKHTDDVMDGKYHKDKSTEQAEDKQHA